MCSPTEDLGCQPFLILRWLRRRAKRVDLRRIVRPTLLGVDDPDWDSNRLSGHKPLELSVLLQCGWAGWEAGIRTPITWSREPFTGFRAFPSVCFCAVSVATTSRRLRSVSMRSRALCLNVSHPMLEMPPRRNVSVGDLDVPDQRTGTPSKYARAFCHTRAPIRRPSARPSRSPASK
jgi:hypothetical protein